MTHLEVTYQETGMRASLTVEVAVVRARVARVCQQCHRRRVLFTLSFTDTLLGNPDTPWRCAPCWGLR